VHLAAASLETKARNCVCDLAHLAHTRLLNLISDHGEFQQYEKADDASFYPKQRFEPFKFF